MTRQEKIQFIAEDFANFGDYPDIIADITQWSDEQMDDYIYRDYDLDYCEAKYNKINGKYGK